MKGEDTITCWGIFLLTSRVMNPSPPTEQPEEKMAGQEDLTHKTDPEAVPLHLQRWPPSRFSRAAQTLFKNLNRSELLWLPGQTHKDQDDRTLGQKRRAKAVKFCSG